MGHAVKQSIVALALVLFAGIWAPAGAETNQAFSATIIDGAPPHTRLAPLGQATIRWIGGQIEVIELESLFPKPGSFLTVETGESGL